MIRTGKKRVGNKLRGIDADAILAADALDNGFSRHLPQEPLA